MSCKFSVTTTPVCHCSKKSAIDNTKCRGNDCVSIKQFQKLVMQDQLGQMQWHVWWPGDSENMPPSKHRKTFSVVEDKVEKSLSEGHLPSATLPEVWVPPPWCSHSPNSTLLFISSLQVMYSILIGQTHTMCCTVMITWMIMDQSPKRWQPTWHLVINYLLSTYYVPGSAPGTWGRSDEQKEFSFMELIV